MSVSSLRSTVSGEGYQANARGFESVVGYSTAGGNDVARIYAETSSQQWIVTADMVRWAGDDDRVHIARGFDRTEAFEDYEPIELRPLSIDSLIRHAIEDDPKRLAELEANASRQVFEEFGSRQ